MRISGAGAVRAPAETVWAGLADRDVLVAAFPGTDRLDVAGNGRREFRVTIPVAAVSGTYAGTAVLTRADAPGELVAKVSAAGERGSVDARITVRLRPGSSGGTELSYEADAEVAGQVAGIGQRLLTSIAARLAAEFIAGLDRALSAPPASARPEEQPLERPEEQPLERPEEQPLERPAEWLAGRPEGPPPHIDRAESAVRTGLIVGAAAGLGGLLIGVLLGRRSRSQPPGRR